MEFYAAFRFPLFKTQKTQFGLMFPEEIPLFGPSRRPFLRTRMQKTTTCETVPVLGTISTLVRFRRWLFFAYVYAKTGSEMVQKVEFPLETVGPN